MIQFIGYTALILNLASMSMKSILYLRTCALVANAFYVYYGMLLEQPPIFIGCTVAIILHTIGIRREMRKRTTEQMK
jgi:hypothetical protein